MKNILWNVFWIIILIILSIYAIQRLEEASNKSINGISRVETTLGKWELNE